MRGFNVKLIFASESDNYECFSYFPLVMASQVLTNLKYVDLSNLSKV